MNDGWLVMIFLGFCYLLYGFIWGIIILHQTGIPFLNDQYRGITLQVLLYQCKFQKKTLGGFKQYPISKLSFFEKTKVALHI